MLPAPFQLLDPELCLDISRFVVVVLAGFGVEFGSKVPKAFPANGCACRAGGNWVQEVGGVGVQHGYQRRVGLSRHDRGDDVPAVVRAAIIYVVRR